MAFNEVLIDPETGFVHYPNTTQTSTTHTVNTTGSDYVSPSNYVNWGGYCQYRLPCGYCEKMMKECPRIYGKAPSLNDQLKDPVVPKVTYTTEVASSE